MKIDPEELSAYLHMEGKNSRAIKKSLQLILTMSLDKIRVIVKASYGITRLLLLFLLLFSFSATRL